ncbi:MAG TPA: hypothetical protein VF812_11405 [Ktedonobacterales bacterium]
MSRRRTGGGIRGSHILGGVIVAVCGLVLYWLLAALQEAIHPTLGDVGTTITALGLLALVGAVGAYLLRSWWAILIVPACFLVFWYLGGVIDALLPGRLYRPWELSGLAGMLGIFALVILPPLLVGAVIGVAVSQRAQRLRASS